jgi:AraC-like DNA-binding protein
MVNHLYFLVVARDSMNFKEALSSTLNAGESLTNTIPKSDDFLKFSFVPEEIAENLSYIQAYNSITAFYPYHYEISKLNSYCLIYTQIGSGLLTLNSGSYTIKRGTIAFIDCKRWHRIEVKEPPWTYKVLFISGSPVSFFHHCFVNDHGNLCTLMPGTAIPNKIEFLCDFLHKSPDKPLFNAKYISDILFELLLEKERLLQIKLNINNCIYQIKNDLDNRYTDNISLELLEKKYHISKYHICREFTKHFHISPIRYLNLKKITAAKELLVHTDKKINEIGRITGFENPNNFIRHFKKQIGVTPLEYRKHILTDKIDRQYPPARSFQR